jgi:hypothetical protein
MRNMLIRAFSAGYNLGSGFRRNDGIGEVNLCSSVFICGEKWS